MSSKAFSSHFLLWYFLNLKAGFLRNSKMISSISWIFPSLHEGPAKKENLFPSDRLNQEAFCPKPQETFSCFLLALTESSDLNQSLQQGQWDVLNDLN
jgi:hypothetical protein